MSGRFDVGEKPFMLRWRFAIFLGLMAVSVGLNLAAVLLHIHAAEKLAFSTSSLFVFIGALIFDNFAEQMLNDRRYFELLGMIIEIRKDLHKDRVDSQRTRRQLVFLEHKIREMDSGDREGDQ